MGKRFTTLRNPEQDKKTFTNRVIILAIIIGILAAVLVVRLIDLQVFQHRFYTTLAQQNLLNLLPSEPNRGLIYDKNGVLLADNIPVYNLIVVPSGIANLNETITEVRKVIPVSDDDLQQFYRQLKMQRRFAPAVLRTRLTEEEVAKFSVNAYRFPGVSIQAQMIRHYPLGSAFAQVVGYVGRINAQELLHVDPSNYSATNFIGKTGIEKYYETELHGNVGYQQAEMDASGKVIRIVNSTASVAGQNLYLTVDSRLQMAAEQLIGTERAAIVAIDPQTGGILALVSNPSFDPNLFVAGISKTDYDNLQNASGQPLFNRALQGKFPPGSTVKPVMSVEGLVSGAITPTSSVICPGFYKLPNSSHIYHDWQRRGHGVVDVVRAITVSCDTFFYTLANKLGIDRIDQIFNEFGFGQPTGVDLTGEASGLVPSPAWKEKFVHQPWYPGDTLITGIGQGYMLVTPLQLAEEVAIIAMRGEHIVPHVLLRSVTTDGDKTDFKPVYLSKLSVPDSVWNVIYEGMQDVTSIPAGTGYQFFKGATYTVAAKSGTAQVFSLKKNQQDKANLLPENLRDNALFIAFAPVNKPQIALVILLQNSSVHGGVLARQILDDYFAENAPVKTPVQSSPSAALLSSSSAKVEDPKF